MSASSYTLTFATPCELLISLPSLVIPRSVELIFLHVTCSCFAEDTLRVYPVMRSLPQTLLHDVVSQAFETQASLVRLGTYRGRACMQALAIDPTSLQLMVDPSMQSIWTSLTNTPFDPVLHFTSTTSRFTPDIDGFPSIEVRESSLRHISPANTPAETPVHSLARRRRDRVCTTRLSRELGRRHRVHPRKSWHYEARQRHVSVPIGSPRNACVSRACSCHHLVCQS